MLLGLDLASRLSGWCCGDGRAVPLCGAWPFQAVDGDYGFLLDQLDGYLQAAFTRFRPTRCAYEAPILVPRGRGGRQYGDKLSTLRLLYPMGAYVEFACRRAGIECFEVTVSDIKSEVTGNAYAPKGDIVAIARKCGLALPDGPGVEDAADAFGAWLLLLRGTDKHLSAEWDRKVWTPRGALL